MSKPPAFPHIAFNTTGGINVVEPGISKREFFAAFALAGMLAREDHYPSVAVESALHFADAMLRAGKQIEQETEP